MARGETITARTLLDRGAQRIDRELAAEPQVRASAARNHCRSLPGALGVFDQSEALARRSLELNGGMNRGSGPENSRTVELLAELYRDKGEYAQAEPLLDRVLDWKSASFGKSSPQAAAVMGEIGECFYWEAKDDQAIALLRETLAIDRKNGPDYGASTRNYLALTLERRGDFDEARHLLEEAVEINRRTLEGPIARITPSACITWAAR